MDLLNKAYVQLSDLFKSMSPVAQMGVVLLLGVVGAGLAYLVNHTATDQNTFLMGGESFGPSHLADMQSAFSQAKLTDYVIDGNRVRVPQGKQAAYIAALTDAGALPLTFGKYLEKATHTDFLADKDQRRLMTMIGRQNELQLIISQMHGIETASVMYDIDEKQSFGKEKIITASVSVKPLGTAPLDEQQARKIRNLVAGAIAGMKPQNVTVTDLRPFGRSYPGTSGAGGVSSGADDYASRKKMYEKDWVEKITGALSYIPGVLVTSNVELDIEPATAEVRTDIEPRAATPSAHSTPLSKWLGGPTVGQSSAPTPIGSNLPAAVGSAVDSNNVELESQSGQQSSIARNSQHAEQQGSLPKQVTVAVSIPSSYYKKVWCEQNPPLPGQRPCKPGPEELSAIEGKETKNVYDLVQGLLHSTASNADSFRVTVTSFQHLSPPGVPTPSFGDTMLNWCGQHWTRLGLIGAGAMGLVLFGSIVRASSAARVSRPKTLQSFSQEAADQVGVDSAKVHERHERPSASGRALRHELSELVKEDPDAAAGVLRAWIGNAS